MIDNRAIERFGGAGEPGGCPFVAVARRRIPAGMIVGEEDCRAVVGGRIANDRAEREVGAGFIAFVMAEMEAGQLLVEMGDPQPLERRVGLGKTVGKEGSGGGEAVDLERGFGTLMLHLRTLGEAGFAGDRNRLGSGEMHLHYGVNVSTEFETTETYGFLAR